jgi:hypothetical protein
MWKFRWSEAAIVTLRVLELSVHKVYGQIQRSVYHDLGGIMSRICAVRHAGAQRRI